ncbi:MAG: zinc ribbon domain-containing protein [Nitrospirae bacterium]|nr:zinc ribbon domain-containing protein [Nitrospirota bacterium]
MPIYEYTCMKCNNSFSVLQKMGASENETSCPDCGAKDVKKKMSAFCCSPGNGASSSPSSYPRFGGGGGG